MWLHNDRLSILFEQIQLPDELIKSHCKDASLSKLTVYKEKNLWQCHIHNSRPFSFEAIQLFSLRLSEAFHHIGKTEVVVQTDVTELSDEELLHYWKYFINGIDLFPAYRDYVCAQKPQIEGAKLVIYARN